MLLFPMQGGVDYSFSAVNVTFSEGMTRQCVMININDDDLLENSESFFVELATFQRNVILDSNQTTVNIADNDGELTIYCCTDL